MTGALDSRERVRLHGGGELARSAGTMLAARAECYAPGARVPRGPWTPASPEAFAPAGATWDPARHVALVALPPAVTSAVRRLGLDRLGEAAARSQLGSVVAAGMLAQAVRAIDPLVRPGTEVTTIGWFAQRAATTTFTINGETGLRTGLHVDSWERRPLAERDRSRNRLCMNVGAQPRYLLFVDLTLHGIHEALGRPDLDPGFGLGRRFLELHPDHPVTRLAVPPGHAYIAPTENLLHDAAPCVPGALDLSCQLLGHFRPPVEDLSGRL